MYPEMRKQSTTVWMLSCSIVLRNSFKSLPLTKQITHFYVGEIKSIMIEVCPRSSFVLKRRWCPVLQCVSYMPDASFYLTQHELSFYGSRGRGGQMEQCWIVLNFSKTSATYTFVLRTLPQSDRRRFLSM